MRPSSLSFDAREGFRTASPDGRRVLTPPVVPLVSTFNYAIASEQEVGATETGSGGSLPGHSVSEEAAAPN
jgi:hypothetical protein